MSIKRLNYFNHQFLGDKDFRDEQKYHLEMRRHHNRALHTWGVVEGLEVERRSDREVVVNAGSAIDAQGRELILPVEAVRDLGTFAQNSHTWIAIEYAESQDETDHHSGGGVEGFTRTTESADVHTKRHEPPRDGSMIILARVHLDGAGRIDDVDNTQKRRASARIGPNSITTAELADGSITEQKLAKELSSFGAGGWVRLPFKPSRLELIRMGNQLVEPSKYDPESEFVVDYVSAYCGDRGARGSMGIAIPAGARRILGFSIAGTTKAKIRVHLYMGGWNESERKGERKQLIGEPLEGAFHKTFPLDQELHQHHTLGVGLIAEGAAEINLIGVNFG